MEERDKDVFLTPQPVVGRADVFAGMLKRVRDSGEDSEAESLVSESSSSVGWKKSRKEGALDKTVPLIDVEADKGTEGENPEMEFEQGLKDLAQSIKKARVAVRETKMLSADQSGGGVRQSARGFMLQADRHLALAISVVRGLELLHENKKLKDSIHLRDMGTQSSPPLRAERAAKAREETIAIGNEGEGPKRSRLERQRGKQVIAREKAGPPKGKGSGIPDREREKPARKEEDAAEEDWKTVDRRKRDEEKRSVKKKRKEEEEQQERKRKEIERNERLRKFPPLPKTDAIVIKATQDRSFADLFKDLKSGAGDRLKGIQTVRKSRGGDLVIETSIRRLRKRN